MTRTRTGRLRLGIWSIVLGMAASTLLAIVAVGQSQQATRANFQSFPLRHASAQQIAQHLQKTLGSGTEVVADTSKNRVLVSGSEQSIHLAGELIRQTDRPAVAPPRQATGPQRKQVVGYSVPREKLDAVVQSLHTQFPNQPGLVVTKESRTSQILVIAPANIQQPVAEWMQQNGFARSQPTGGGARTNRQAQDDPRTYQMQHITWREFEANLVSAWGNRLSAQPINDGQLMRVQLDGPNESDATLTIDRTQNRLAFEGSDEIVAAWRRTAQLLDVPRNAENDDTRLFAMVKTEPERVQRAVSYLRLASTQNETGLTSEVLPFSGLNRGHEVLGGHLVSTIFQDQDNGAQPPGNGDNQDATNPSNQDNQDDDQIQGLMGPIQIEFIPELNQFIIRGHPRDIRRVREMVRQIESLAAETQPEIDIYTLEHVDSRAVTTVVQQLYDDVYAPRQGPVRIIPLVKPNVLLIVGRKESAQTVTDLLKRLDIPVPPATEFEVFRLRYISAIDMANRIIELYQGQAQIGGAQPQQTQGTGEGLETRVVVISDFRSNALVVRASPRDLEEVSRLVKELDRGESDARNEVRVFELRNVLAVDLAPILQDVLNGQLPGAGRSDLSQQIGGFNQVQANQLAQIRSAMLTLKMLDPQGQSVDSGILYDVRIAANPNNNSLIVTSPPENMDLIAALIQRLDSLPNAETVVKVFEIKHGDAQSLVQMLQNLFGVQQQAGGFNQQGGIGQLPLQSGSEDSSLVGLRFELDQRTNSIIATGSASDLDVVHALLIRLDREDRYNRPTRVYRLRNIAADDVANAINNWLNTQNTLDQNDPTAVSPFEQLNRAVIVVPEQVGNSLIISATPEFFPRIERIIEDLDRRPPMVMVQVLLAEVTLNDNEELGIEAGLQDSLVFDRGANTIRFALNQAGIGNDNTPLSLGTRETFAGQALSNLNVGRTNADLGFGGLVLSAGNESISVLLRALKQQSRLQVLSRPQIMTLDNLQGFVQVGSQVARVNGQTLTGTGATQLDVSDVSVGVILRVTPRVSPDGLVVMRVDATRSALGNEADGTPVSIDQNGNVLRSPPINITTAQTTVMAHSGQTIVLGGLITTRDDEEMRGVPIISEIPGVGNLFRYDREFQRRTELLIIMTPYVVDGDDDIAMVNQMEMDRMSWCLADVVEVHGSIGYDDSPNFFHGSGPEVIYPDADPTGTQPQLAPTPAQPNTLPITPNSSRRGAGPPLRSGAPNNNFHPTVRSAESEPQALYRQGASAQPVGWNGGTGSFQAPPHSSPWPQHPGTHRPTNPTRPGTSPTGQGVFQPHGPQTPRVDHQVVPSSGTSSYRPELQMPRR